MVDFPLQIFLASLAADDIFLRVRDYDRLLAVFSTGGDWTVSRLGNVLTAFLAKDQDMQRLIMRRFSGFFKGAGAEKPLPEIDIRRVLKELRETESSKPTAPADFPDSLEPPDTGEKAAYEIPGKSRINRFKWLLAGIAVVVTILGIIAAQWLKPQEQRVDKHLQTPQAETEPPSQQAAEQASDQRPSAADVQRQREMKRLYKDVPHVKSVEYKDIVRPQEWKILAWVSGTLIFFLVFHGLWIRRFGKRPRPEKPLDFGEKPVFFHPGVIGGRPQPHLSEEILADVADSMGYFKSGQPGRILNARESVKATVKNGGIPECRFYTRSKIRTLLILEDSNAESLDWNPVAGELARGMRRYGIPVIYGQFSGTPESFTTPDGRLLHLEDMEDHRNGILMLIFTDGKAFHRPLNAFALESVAQWPMKAWMELRERRFWDETLRLPAEKGIPVYPAISDGIVRAVRRFLAETGTKEKESGEPVWISKLPHQADFAEKEDWVKSFLGETLGWAEACAMFQPVTGGMADAIRREFHPELPPEQIECLRSLPNTTWTEAGMKFSTEIVKILRNGFLKHRTEDEQQAVMDFIVEKVKEVEPEDAERDGSEHLCWEAIYQRVKLDAGSDDGLKRFEEILRTPLEGFIGASLENHDFEGRDDKIPLRKEYRGKALRRLSRLKGDPLGVRKSLLRRHRIGFGVIASAFVIMCGLTLWSWYDSVTAPVQNFKIVGLENAEARLLKWDKGEWSGVKSLDEVLKLKRLPQPEGDAQKYRLVLYDAGYGGNHDFEIRKDFETVLTLGKQGVELPCVSRDGDVGLTVARCSETATEGADSPLQIKTWQQRLGDRAPAGRMTSVGIELAEKGLENDDLNRLGNRLLETGSIDVLYRIQPNGAGKWAVRDALQKIEDDAGFSAAKSQLIWWEAGQTPGLAKELRNDFQRTMRLGRGDDLAWVVEAEKVFAAGETPVVTEREILRDVGNVEIDGQGLEIALIRPVEVAPVRLEFALSVNTVPETAQVRIMNIAPKYEKSILLKPGRYDIEVTDEGYETYREWITVGDEDLEIEVQLVEILTGKLLVTTVPASASVKAEPADGGESRSIKSGESLELVAGKWTVSAQAKGYEEVKKPVIVKKGKESKVSLELPVKTRRAGTEWVEPVTGMKFVWVPAGTFKMGCLDSRAGNCDDDEKPAHTVKLDGFWMERHEVANSQFVVFLNESGRSTDKKEPWFETKAEDSYSQIVEKGGKFFVEKGYENYPVVNVSWYGAKAFAGWLSRRTGRPFDLPSEAQWEYAARAGTDTPFAFGKCLSTDQANYDGNYPLSGCSKGEYRGRTISVTSLAKNSWGLYHMHGNVWEWCRDWYGSKYYGNAAVSGVNPEGPSSGSVRVLRGGSWYYVAWYCRSADRYWDGPAVRDFNVGFRLVLLAGQKDSK